MAAACGFKREGEQGDVLVGLFRIGIGHGVIDADDIQAAAGHGECGATLDVPYVSFLTVFP